MRAKRPTATRPDKLNAHSDPNITPLIDVLLVLLIIFMAALPLSQEGLDLSLPQDVQPRNVPPPVSHVVLEYAADRQVTINHEPVPLAALEEKLRAIFAQRRDKTLYVSGAPSLRYGEIVQVIDAAKGAGVQKVGIVTERMRAGR